jgi:tryptophan-rich sensory protein
MLEGKELHLLVPIVLALILNYIISIKKWDDKKSSLLPSGPYIGLIWIVILLCLGNAHYILYEKSKISFASIYLIFVIIYCLSYPIITQLDRKKGAVLNTIAMILTSILLLVVYQESTEALLYTIPLFLWISFVNYSDAIVCSGFSFSDNKPKKKPKKKSKKKTEKNDISRVIVL